MKNLINSFGFAIKGVFIALVKERNMRIHTVCMIYMFFFLFAFDFFRITRAQLAILLLACGQVVAAELVNTAIEAIIDAQGDEHTAHGKIAKDCAAGAVLVLAGFSVLCGVAIMYQPTAFKLLFTYFIENPIAIVLFILSVIIFTIFIFKGIPLKRENK